MDHSNGLAAGGGANTGPGEEGLSADHQLLCQIGNCLQLDAVSTISVRRQGFAPCVPLFVEDKPCCGVDRGEGLLLWEYAMPAKQWCLVFLTHKIPSCFPRHRPFCQNCGIRRWICLTQVGLVSSQTASAHRKFRRR